MKGCPGLHSRDTGSLCQRPAWELLRDHFGYEYVDGRSEAFQAARESETEPLLLRRLESVLKRINPGLTDAECDRPSTHFDSRLQRA